MGDIGKGLLPTLGGILLLLYMLFRAANSCGLFDSNPQIDQRWPGEDAKPIPTATPIMFSDEQAGNSLLAVNDFPDGWQVNRQDMTVSGTRIQFLTVKKIHITLKTHETEVDAQAAFSNKKVEVQENHRGQSRCEK